MQDLNLRSEAHEAPEDDLAPLTYHLIFLLRASTRCMKIENVLNPHSQSKVLVIWHLDYFYPAKFLSFDCGVHFYVLRDCTSLSISETKKVFKFFLFEIL